MSGVYVCVWAVAKGVSTSERCKPIESSRADQVSEAEKSGFVAL